MYGKLSAFMGASALSFISNLTPEQIEKDRLAAEARDTREAENAARDSATKSKPRSSSLERILGKRKNRY